jgi:LCP family protein required for cell wall assembly
MHADVDPSGTSPRPRAKHPLLAAFLSVLLPGAGQLYAGRVRRGTLFMALSLGAGVAAVALLVRDPLATLKVAFSPTVLTSLLVVDVVVLVCRGYVAVDAYRVTPEGPRPGRWMTAAAVTAIAGVLVVPHAVFAYYDIVQHDLITSVFVTDPPVTTPTPTTATTIATTTTTAPGSTAAAESTSTTVIDATTSTTRTTTTAVPGPWSGLDRLNILLLGSDAGVGRTGVRTDTMILVSVEPESGDAAVFGIPRNLRNAPLPSSVGIWGCDCFPAILNELYGFGEGRPDAFPGTATPGANAIKAAAAELLGIPVHYYALVSLDGFVDVVDALGGVDITVTEPIYDPAYPNEDGTTSVVDLSPGAYHFNGHDALIFVRSRHSSDDYDRMGRQRCLLEALADQADPFSVLRNFPRIADALERSLETDIPLDQVPDLIDLLLLIDTDQIVTIRFIPPTYASGRSPDGYPYPNTALIREHVAVVMDLPPLEAMEVLGLEPLADACE